MKVLKTLGFPNSMIKWIEVFISSPKYSISLNEELVGFFGGSKGLRQGDLLSPYLFVIAIEALSRLLNRTTMNSNFKAYKHCKDLNITHLCFINDVMFFSGVEEKSI